MKLVFVEGEFYSFEETKSNDNSSPHGYFNMSGERVIPSIGDTIQHPHDVGGHVLGWIPKVAKALPDDLVLDYGGGLDNDIYAIVSDEQEVA